MFSNSFRNENMKEETVLINTFSDKLQEMNSNSKGEVKVKLKKKPKKIVF